MSTQGGGPRTKPVRENGQQQEPKRPSGNEGPKPVDEGGAAAPKPAVQPDGPPPVRPQPLGQSPGQPPGQPEQEGGETVRMRASSLTTEAPPPPIELRKKKSSNSGGSRLPRKAHLVLRRVEPWSAMKFSFVVSLVCFVVLFVAVAVLYGVLSALGVFDSLVDLVNQLGKGEQGQSSIPIDIASWFEPVRILGYTALIGAVNVVLITALATLGAVIYNVASDLVGGVEVTFSEAE
ncbi:DUF3566 domain-containing protein [Nonomuraea glycinis]|uniref:DUF3566 domain-containing protein n=1 Tax=Nonomuraea glycinis TaxID=2047744 RepID=A0A918E3Y0_9ACTN|nr:DUF3566 domain-containing protein [Nonomuraea glycinis]MCA2176879.1 DUF3566 domain-containing protein [Nonomuraea glycinis]WSG70401.1 DUF3566 domain-containing protein [Nonomuraea glycinis]GGP03123.1 hypothetical protein GCM10012278_13080 [Nonomuraea glycinis]